MKSPRTHPFFYREIDYKVAVKNIRTHLFCIERQAKKFILKALRRIGFVVRDSLIQMSRTRTDSAEGAEVSGAFTT